MQRVKLTSRSRYALVPTTRFLKLNSLRLTTFLIPTSALAFALFCPLPVRIVPTEVQDILRKHKKRPETEYGEFWQKERRRLDQLNRQAEDAESTTNSPNPSDASQTSRGAVFIPITWPSKRKREYYSASDPEWQEFVAMSRDPNRIKAVKSGLCDSLRKEISNHQTVTRVTGEPLTVSASWLDFDFPAMAPAEYERSGIIWVDNTVTWATRRVDDRQAKRLNRVLFPTALFSSMQAASSILLKSQYGSFRALWSRSAKHKTFADKPAEESVSPKVAQDESKGASTLSIQKRSNTAQQSLSLATIPSMRIELIRNIMPESEPNSAVSAAAKEFKLNFMKNWRKSHVVYPRGTCLLKGEVGMKGPNGRCKLSVAALYLPKEHRFVHVLATISGIWPKNQPPLGRPKRGTSSKT